MHIMIINGPNLNMLGVREPEIYGHQTLKDLYDLLKKHSDNMGVDITFLQSNHEGEIIDFIQRAYLEKYDGIIINPAAYTHTSIAIYDAIKSINVACVEVHLSDIAMREDFRHHSYIEKACKKTIKGKGFDGYIEAFDFLCSRDALK